MLAMPAAVSAAESTDIRTDYSLQSWDERDGLPSGRIWAITQDRDGYLWLGSEAGLIRFDGVRFSRWTSDEGAPFLDQLIVFSLRYARDGSLWMGFQSGGIGRIHNGRLQRFDVADGLGEGRVRFILEDREQSIWAGGPGGIYQFRAGRWHRVSGRVGLPAGGASDAYEDRTGRLWVATDTGIYVRDGGNEFRRAGSRLAEHFSEDAAGTLWVTDPDTGFARLDRQPASQARMPALGQVLLHDRTGTLWVGTAAHGVLRVGADTNSPAGSQQISAADGLSSDNIRALFEDRDGNIWVGTGAGLDRLTARRIRQIEETFYSLAIEATPDGRVWVATSNGLFEYGGATPRRYDRSDGLPSQYIRALFTDRHGALWIATDRGVVRRGPRGFERLDIPGFPMSRLVAIAADSHGTLWLCDRDRGAFVWRAGRLAPLQPPAPSVDGNVNFVYVDRRDRLWIGYPQGKVVEVRPDGETITHALGATIGAVLSAAYEDRYGTVWIGGSRGLGRIQGNAVKVFPQPTALPGNGVFAIAEDLEGDLWLGVSSGVLRLRQSDVRLAAEGSHPLRYRFYDASDGLVGVPPRLGFPGATRRTDGTVWFITTRGASVVRPQAFDRTTRPPMLRIETIKANDQPVPLKDGAVLPPGHTQLLFEYTAINLTSPAKERFRYQLEGVDRNWVEAGTRRQAFYANLGSGTYRFRLARVTDEAEPADTSVVWAFSISPMFYETGWFMAVCVGGLGVVGWTAWRMRSRQLRRQFALVFAERARMSQELHDTLLQNVAAIALHFDHVATKAEAAGSPLKDQLVPLRRHLEEAVVEARRFVWDLRSGTLEENGLPHVLQESGSHTFGESRTQFTMRVSGAPRRCPAAVEHHLMRIAQEALSNAARYAEATTVHLDLHYEDGVVRMQVADDGRGLQNSGDAGRHRDHYGLRIMEERAAAIGATFQVMTSPGEGTRIEVVMPLAAGT
jgi:signal transduction histidine kinase/ligand-binding sensor domain-containing protein